MRDFWNDLKGCWSLWLIPLVVVMLIPLARHIANLTPTAAAERCVGPRLVVSDDTSRPRVVTAAIVRDNATGKEWLVISTGDHLQVMSVEPRAEVKP
jgi:hypothetical protein